LFEMNDIAEKIKELRDKLLYLEGCL